MRYEFLWKNRTKIVEIPDEWLRQQSRTLGITKMEAIHLWLYDNGYEDCAEAEQLTAKAKAAGVMVKGDRKKREAPKRKPDETKRELIKYLQECMNKIESLDVNNIEVTNVERIISFAIGEDKYELTLSKKRKPKD